MNSTFLFKRFYLQLRCSNQAFFGKNEIEKNRVDLVHGHRVQRDTHPLIFFHLYNVFGVCLRPCGCLV
jgi:hypothetical protein